jgi:hypothetical protein
MSTQRKPQAEGIPVQTRALLARVNRHLVKQGEVLRATRGEGIARQEFGAYYRLDTHNNLVVDKHVDLEELARQLGALKPYERVVND